MSADTFAARAVRALLSNGVALVNPLYSPPGELPACPACGSEKIEHLVLLCQICSLTSLSLSIHFR